jgi:hypothetical protein
VARNLDRLSLSLVLKLAEFALKFQGARLNHGGLSHWDIQLVLSRFLSLRWQDCFLAGAGSSDLALPVRRKALRDERAGLLLEPRKHHNAHSPMTNHLDLHRLRRCLAVSSTRRGFNAG